MELEARVGLSPEEMITTFNRMYQDSWQRSQENIDWQAANLSQRLQAGEEVDLAGWIVGVMERVMTAARDATAYTLLENNQRVAQQLLELGVPVPMEEVPEVEEEEGMVDVERWAEKSPPPPDTRRAAS